MRTRIGWGNNFISKFDNEGAMEGSEPDTKSTPATKLSSRHVQSARRVRQKNIKNNLRDKSDEEKQEVWDMETAEVYSIKQEEPTVETDIHKIMHSMKRGKRSARQREKNYAPWVYPLRFLKSCGNSVGPPQNHLGVCSKMMRRTRARTKSLCMIDREAKEKKNVGGDEGDGSNADAASSENSRVESASERPCDDDCMAECVKFAVKLLKDEILPVEFSEVEEFFKQMICHQKSKVIAGPSQSSLSRKG